MNKFARFSGTPDSNEREVIIELEQRGALVVVIDRPTDLVVGYAGRWVFVEVKSSPRAKLRKSQKSFLQRAANQGLPSCVIRSMADIDQYFPEVAGIAPVRFAVADDL